MEEKFKELKDIVSEHGSDLALDNEINLLITNLLNQTDPKINKLIIIDSSIQKYSEINQILKEINGEFSSVYNKMSV
jgi:hypothetical protein